MTGRVTRQSRQRPPKCRFSRSDGCSQGRRKTTRAARAPLTAGRRGGYPIFRLVLIKPATCVRFDGGNSNHIGPAARGIMDATTLLTKDHEAVRQLFAEFESTESDDSKADLYEDLREQLLIHARVEEDIFYPAIREADPEKGDQQIKEALGEHQHVEQVLGELDKMAADIDAGFAETMRKLANSVEHHVEEEENQIFVSARKLGDERLRELGGRLQERKDQLRRAGIDDGDQSA